MSSAFIAQPNYHDGCCCIWIATN